MTAALVCGAGVGVGMLLILRGMFPARVPLAAALDRLQRVDHDPAGQRIGRNAGDSDEMNDGLAGRVGAPIARQLMTLPLISKRTRSDLAILGRPPERHLAEKATLGIVGFLIVPAFAEILAIGGVSLGWLLPIWVAVLLGVGGFLVPDLGIRVEADKRRADFRHALGSFLDLVVISLAGGSGVEGALSEAAVIGRGWSFARLRRAIEEARLMRIAPWGPLGRLGEAFGIDELCELAATVALAGTEGSKVRATLAAKAKSIRTHALAEAQANAEAMSERMSLPVVVLFGGFLLFIGYPALAHVLAGI
jgi:tight adherence protein C